MLREEEQSYSLLFSDVPKLVGHAYKEFSQTQDNFLRGCKWYVCMWWTNGVSLHMFVPLDVYNQAYTHVFLPFLGSAILWA